MLISIMSISKAYLLPELNISRLGPSRWPQTTRTLIWESRFLTQSFCWSRPPLGQTKIWSVLYLKVTIFFSFREASFQTASNFNGFFLFSTVIMVPIPFRPKWTSTLRDSSTLLLVSLLLLYVLHTGIKHQYQSMLL